MVAAGSSPKFPTSLGTSHGSTISVMGKDLSADFIGRIGFGTYAYQLVMLTEPTPQQGRMFEAVLVALAEHGFTPTAIVTRLTWLSAPDSVQGAIAAGLLGGGDRYLGVTENTGKFLHEIIERTDPLPVDDAGWDALALDVVSIQKEAGRFVPGLGHPEHKQGDPRTPRIIGIANDEGVFGPHLALFEAIGRVHEQVLGRWLPLNGAGVCGAALADLGLPVELLRGVALLSRCAGLLGHLADELRHPIASSIFDFVDRNAEYVGPGAPDPGDDGGPDASGPDDGAAGVR